jgi:hypothetical protein
MQTGIPPKTRQTANISLFHNNSKRVRQLYNAIADHVLLSGSILHSDMINDGIWKHIHKSPCQVVDVRSDCLNCFTSQTHYKNLVKDMAQVLPLPDGCAVRLHITQPRRSDALVRLKITYTAPGLESTPHMLEPLLLVQRWMKQQKVEHCSSGRRVSD